VENAVLKVRLEYR